MDAVTRRRRVATVWLGGCSGCHMSFLDLDERLVDLAGRIELCASPLTDHKDFPEVDVTLVEGAVANTDHLVHIRTVRARSRLLVSFGDCAVTGNVTALRNLFDTPDVLDRAYRQTAAVVRGVPPDGDLLPRLLERVLPVHQVVTVDVFLPGCPPAADTIHAVLLALLDGRTPPPGGRFG